MSVKSGLNDSSDGEAVIVGGRSFHAVDAAAGKARSPSDVRRVDETTSDFDIRSTANLPSNLPMKEFLKSVKS